MWQKFDRKRALTCEQLRVQLPAYFDGELPAARQGAIREHLATCDACARYASEARTLEADLVAAAQRRARHIKLSPQTSARVQERVYWRMRRAVIIQRVTQFSRGGVALVVLALVVGAFALWQGEPPATGKTGSGQQTIPAAPEVQSLKPTAKATVTAYPTATPPPTPTLTLKEPLSTRDEVVSLSQAIAEAGFDFLVPTFLPDGFVLSQVRLYGAAPYDVFMTYEGTEGRLELRQILVGVISVEYLSPTGANVVAKSVEYATDGTPEEVMVGTTPATLLKGEWLVWEEDNISFAMKGPGLELETLVRIAESLVPARQWDTD